MIELPREAVGFHGTSRDAVVHLLARDIRPSDQHFEWLGTGFYLWQDSRGALANGRRSGSAPTLPSSSPESTWTVASIC